MCKNIVVLMLSILMTFLFFSVSFGVCSSSEKGLVFCADVATFVGTENTANVEIYYKVDNNQLTFIDINEFPSIPDDVKAIHAYAASFEVFIQLYDAKGDEITSDTRVQTVLSETLVDTKSNQLFALDQRMLVLSPGEYRLQIKVTDLNSSDQKSGWIFIPVKYSGIEDHSFLMSDLQLSTFIQEYQQNFSNPKFVKSGLEVTPNPSTIFGNRFPNLYAYYEIYDLEATDLDSVYEVVEILDENNDVVKSLDATWIKQTNNVTVRVQRMLVGDLVEGTYALVVKITDGDQQTITAQKTFEVKMDVDDDPFLTDAMGDFSNYTTKQLDDLFRGLEYVATNSEQKQIGRLKKEGTDAEKRKFLLDFWTTRGADAQTAHYERVGFANQSYSEHGYFREGWKTAKGRVYIKYGPPSEVELHDMVFEAHSYEIWRYYSLRYYFVFFDENTLGSYRLIDSNAPGEISDPKWAEQYKDDFIRGGNANEDEHFDDMKELKSPE